MGFRAWRLARVRAIGRDHYVRFTPSLGFALPWFRSRRGERRRLRWARHHGLQVVTWRGNRWIVTRQLIGTSTVKGERYG